MILALLFAVAVTAETYDDLALKKCKPNDINWSIHGYWPEFNVSTWPQNCNQTKCDEFDVSALAALSNQLQKYWFSCPEWPEFDSNEDFWRHEWCKHATCMKQNVDLLTYFGGTIKLFLSSMKQDWYQCCPPSARESQCLLHFNKTTKNWLGYC